MPLSSLHRVLAGKGQALTWPPTIFLGPSKRPYWDRDSAVCPEQDRAAGTLRWIDLSGPCFVTVPGKVIAIGRQSVTLLFEDDEEELEYPWSWFSYCTELMLRKAIPGDELEVKIRVDDVKSWPHEIDHS